MLTFIRQALSTPARLFTLVFAVYFLSSFLSVSLRGVEPLPGDAALRYRQNYWAMITLPRILRGDEMHYLLMAHSLAHDGDLYLSREYTHVQQGGPEMGVYHRGRGADNIFQHFSRSPDYTLLGNHPFGFSALLAMLLWPFAGTFWMEPAAIWVTVFWGAMGVLVFLRVLLALEFSWSRARNTALLLAFATPWWSYSRTLYTEVYIGTAMLIVMYAVLRNRALWALPFVVAMAWFKYPAMALFFGAGTGEALYRRWRNFFIFGFTGAAVLASVYAFNLHYFEGASWITRSADQQETRLRSVARAGAPIAWMPGNILENVERLFKDFDKGLFPHCPILVIAGVGLWAMWRSSRRPFWLLISCALPWFLVHITYEYLMAGASYTTRYLVPIVPMVMIGLPYFWEWSASRRPFWRHAAMFLISVSLLNNAFAGMLPGITFNRKPWEIWWEPVVIIKALITGGI